MTIAQIPFFKSVSIYGLYVQMCMVCKCSIKHQREMKIMGCYQLQNNEDICILNNRGADVSGMCIVFLLFF